MLLYFFSFWQPGAGIRKTYYLWQPGAGSWGPIVFGNRKPGTGIFNLFSGVPLHYELGDKVAAIPCWQGDNQYQVG